MRKSALSLPGGLFPERMRKMKAEREKINAKVKADTLRLTGGRLELTADEEMCTFVLVSEGSCTVQLGETSLLVNPGSALLLGAGDAVLTAAGAAVPELVGCRFPLSALHELRSATQQDFARLFLPGEATVLYGPVLWTRRLRTLLEMMQAAMPEQDYPGGLYLLLILHYVEQECLAESSAAARPRNETIEQVCAHLAANYPQKFSLTEVAAKFYLSPYYLSRLFRRVTGHRGLPEQPPHRGCAEAAGNHRAFHQRYCRADRFCQRRPLPPRVPRGNGHQPPAVPQEK
jgi:AraC-like DNA-binding protein